MKQVAFKVIVEVEDDVDVGEFQGCLLSFLEFGADEASSVDGGIEHVIVVVEETEL